MSDDTTNFTLAKPPAPNWDRHMVDAPKSTPTPIPSSPSISPSISPAPTSPSPSPSPSGGDPGDETLEHFEQMNQGDML